VPTPAEERQCGASDRRPETAPSVASRGHDVLDLAGAPAMEHCGNRDRLAVDPAEQVLKRCALAVPGRGAQAADVADEPMSSLPERSLTQASSSAAVSIRVTASWGGAMKPVSRVRSASIAGSSSWKTSPRSRRRRSSLLAGARPNVPEHRRTGVAAKAHQFLDRRQGRRIDAEDRVEGFVGRAGDHRARAFDLEQLCAVGRGVGCEAFPDRLLGEEESVQIQLSS
jgi:hypothetical protein